MRETHTLLLSVLTAAVASPCWQGATFQEAVLSPVARGGIMRVPGAESLPQCVAAACHRPGFRLVWLFRGRCYILSCQQGESCQPQVRPGADSVLAFLQRAPPPALLLQSLVRRDPPEDRFEGPRVDSEGTQEGRGGVSSGAGLNLSESDSGPDRVQNYGTPTAPNSDGGRGRGDQTGTETATGASLGAGLVATLEASPGPGAGSGASPGVGPEAGAGPGVGPGASPGAGLGAGLGAGPGADPDADPRASPGAGPDADPRASPGAGAGPGAGPRAGPGAGLETGPGAGLRAGPGADLGPNPGPGTGPRAGPGAGPDAGPRASPGPVMGETSSVTDSAPPGHVTVWRDIIHPTGGAVALLQEAPPTADILFQAVTSDPSDPRTSAAAPVAGSALLLCDAGPNQAPLAVVGPNESLFLPLSSVLLNGSGSTDDGGISSYSWEVVSAPPGLTLEDADQAVATVTGIQSGCYVFRLTVSDQQGATDSAELTVTLQEARSSVPVAHASGSHVLTLPNNSLVLRGSVTDGDQTKVRFLWTRDSQSPAAGEVLYGSDTQPFLYLTGLVEGTYLFQLMVTDAQSRSSCATATVEVRAEPGGGEQVDLELLVSVSQMSVSQRDIVVGQLAALVHVPDTDVHVRTLQRRTDLSSVLRFSVLGPSGPLPASGLVVLLGRKLLGEKKNLLLFKVLRVDAVVCQLRCSGRGQCDPVTKQCSCDPFWTENLVRLYLGDGESNCEWRVLYVVLSSFSFMTLILTFSWTFICCSRRRWFRWRKKTRYTILDDMDEQERLELRPRFSIKHRSTEQNSSLMMSESELDSDPDRNQARQSGNTLG